MRIIGQNSLASLVKYILYMVFAGGIAIFISLPISLSWYLSMTYGTVSDKIFYFLLGLLYATGLLALLIVFEIIKIFKSLDGKEPFIMSNAISLNRMGTYSFFIAFFYIFKVFFFNSIATLIIIMIFVIAGFFSIILSEVFRQAVEAKQENDLTI